MGQQVHPGGHRFINWFVLRAASSLSTQLGGFQMISNAKGQVILVVGGLGVEAITVLARI
eukprot:4336918-Pleurochrysis_carterae.AAC.1